MPNAPAKAVRAMCTDCIYDPKDKGSAVQQIEACTCSTCPLYPYRPLTGPTKQRLKEEAFNALSPEQKAEALVKRQTNIEKLALAHSKLSGNPDETQRGNTHV